MRMDKSIEDIETILENARSITRIIENILMRFRQDQNEKEELIDVNETIRQEIIFFDSYLYFKHRIAKRYNLDPNLEKVRVVHSDLSRIFDTLIKNDLEAMYDSPLKKLTISNSQDGRNIYIDFVNSGVGIPEEMIEHLFHPFPYCGVKISERSMGGSGGIESGLPMCMSLIRKYRGNIEVKSRLGEGAAFRLTIPRLQSPS